MTQTKAELEALLAQALGDRDLLRRAYRAMANPGSPEHVAYAKEMLSWVPQPRDEAAFVEGLKAMFLWANGIWEGRETTTSPMLNLSMARDLATCSIGAAWWAHLGFPSFDLTLDFFRAIAVTDFGEVGTDTLHLPFPAFVMRFPEQLGAAQARGIFVYPVPFTRAGAAAEHEFGARRMTINAPDVARQSYSQWIDGTGLDEFLHKTPRRIDDLDPIERAASAELGNELNIDTLKACRRAMANTILYIEAGGGLPKDKHRHGAPAAPVERTHKEAPQYRVGRPIRLGPEIREALEHRQGTAGWKIAQRFIVRGHWRNQAHGPRHQLRTRKWIQPHWKGPKDVAEALVRAFEVE